ncbi:unnamed protein product [Closterium sp. NIES-53]
MPLISPCMLFSSGIPRPSFYLFPSQPPSLFTPAHPIIIKPRALSPSAPSALLSARPAPSPNTSPSTTTTTTLHVLPQPPNQHQGDSPPTACTLSSLSQPTASASSISTSSPNTTTVPSFSPNHQTNGRSIHPSRSEHLCLHLSPPRQPSRLRSHWPLTPLLMPPCPSNAPAALPQNLNPLPGRFTPHGVNTFVFISSHRISPLDFAVIGLSARGMRSQWRSPQSNGPHSSSEQGGEEDESGGCVWVSYEGPHTIKGSLEYLFPGDHGGMPYETIVIRCNLDKRTPADPGESL